MRRPIALLAAACACAAPGSAAAATAGTEVQVSQGKGCSVVPESCVVVRLVYTAAAGEQNSLQLSRAGSSVLVRDATAPLAARSGCEQQDPNTVRCSPPSGPSTGIILVRGSLGDMSDSLENASDVASTFEGGSGDDTLLGGRSSDDFGGGAGRDRMEGRDGFDTLRDGAGGKGVEPDVMDGGDDADTVRYTTRRSRVTVDLANTSGGSGAQGEDDVLVDVESAHGGAGPDVMRAGSASVSFYGRGGNDRMLGSFSRDQLHGDAGDDKLNGFFGRDFVDGGPGADRLLGGCDGDKVHGGAGRDRLFDADGSSDVVRGGADRDFAEHDQLDRIAQVETSVQKRVDGCAL